MQRRQNALALVTLLTLATMAAELVAGWWTGSLALIADGWHMGTHALALGGAVLAYRLSARAVGRAGYAFGGWKIEVLTAYTSALAAARRGGLARLRRRRRACLRHRTVAYADALVVAVIGLVVNLAQRAGCCRAASRGHAPRARPRPRARRTHASSPRPQLQRRLPARAGRRASRRCWPSPRSAGGAVVRLAWLDPAVALLGAARHRPLGARRAATTAAARWSTPPRDPRAGQRVRELIERDGDAKVADLHVWQVGTQAWCAVVSRGGRPAARGARRTAPGCDADRVAAPRDGRSPPLPRRHRTRGVARVVTREVTAAPPAARLPSPRCPRSENRA